MVALAITCTATMILESNLDQAQNESQVAVGQHLQNSFESLVGGFRTGLEELRAVSMLRLEGNIAIASQGSRMSASFSPSFKPMIQDELAWC